MKDIYYSKKKDSLEYAFATNTSCHGLRNVADGSNIVTRCVWFVFVLASFAFLLFQVITAGRQYLDYQAVTEVKVNVSYSNHLELIG